MCEEVEDDGRNERGSSDLGSTLVQAPGVHVLPKNKKENEQ